MPRYLMVPVRLDALYVPGDEMTVVSQRADFSRLPFFDRIAGEEYNGGTANISEAVVSQPFQNENLRLSHGIHLHWALPDGLTRAEDGLRFPPVPNRWLVTRGDNGNNGPFRTKQWIVESDYLFPPGVNKRNESVSIPYLSIHWEKKDGEATYTYKPSGYAYKKSELPDELQRNTELLKTFFSGQDGEYLILDDFDFDDPYKSVSLSPAEKLRFEEFLRHPLHRADQPFRYMGRKMAVSAWKDHFDNAEYYPGLTAVGYGDPTFAAFYPNCFSVFGLHDDLSGLPGDNPSGVRYELAGWYSDGNDDAIARFSERYRKGDYGDIAFKEAVRERFGWDIDSPASSVPDRMLCYAVLSFNFDAAGVPEDPNKADNNVSVTVANTPTEALSACLAKKLAPGDPALQETIENQLEAMQLSFRLDEKQLDAALRFQQLRHENGFVPMDSGHVWCIRKETKTRARNAAGFSPKAGAPDTLEETALAGLPDFLAGELNEVNALQRAYDDARHEIEALRRQLFADWYKYMICVYPPERVTHDYPDPDLVKFFIETTLLGPLRKKIRAVGTLNDPEIREGAVVAVAASGDSDGESLAVRLAAAIDNLLSHIKTAEDAINESALRFSLTETSFEALRGRGLTDVVKKLRSTAKPIVNLDKDGFSNALAERIGRDDFARLAADLFECAEKSGSLSNYYLERCPAPRFWQPSNPVVLIEGPAATPTRRHGQDGELRCDIFDSGNESLSDGVFCAITAAITAACDENNFGFSEWKHQPWNPFLLEWQVKLYPAAGGGNLHADTGAYRKTFITDNYETRPGHPDLLVKKGKGKIADSGRIVSGESILTPQARSLLKGAIETELIGRRQLFKDTAELTPDYFLAKNEPGRAQSFDNPVYTLVRAYRELDGLRCLSQSLNGFNTALVMHKSTMELAVGDPLGFEEYRMFTERRVNETIGQSTRIAPSPLNAFNPIRSGCLKIIRLCLVDTFGQTRELATGTINTACCMRTPSSPCLVRLPPRLAQPVRLNFRWLDGNEGVRETNSLAATSPVCGWLLTNRVDRSLMVYDASGKALGYFQDGAWREAIDSDDAVAIGSIANPHLRRVVAFVESGAAKQDGFLEHFISAIDDALNNIHPENDTDTQSPALLIGRPVAVVRAALHLELRGPPAVNQDWNVFRRDFGKQTRTDDYFSRVRFPVRLGEYTQMNDGLVGYWLESKSGFADAVRLTKKTIGALHAALRAGGSGRSLTNDVLEQVGMELETRRNRIYGGRSELFDDLKKIVATVQLRELLDDLKKKPAVPGGSAESADRMPDVSGLEHLRNLLTDDEDGDFRKFKRGLREILGSLHGAPDGPPEDSNAGTLGPDGGRAAARLLAVAELLEHPLRRDDAPDIGAAAIYYAPQNEYLRKTASEAAGRDGPGESLLEYFDNGAFGFSQSIADPSRIVTMLMDVRGGIRATVGIAPCKEITIPPEQYAHALGNIELSFLHAPILTRQTKIDLLLRPVRQYAWSWVERRKLKNGHGAEVFTWKELFPTCRIEKFVFLEQWNAISRAVPGETVWEYLLSDEVRWLAPVTGGPEAELAGVISKDERKTSEFKPFSAGSATYDIHGLERRVEAILDLYSAGIVPPATDAVFTGPLEIREGWLKLRKAERGIR